MDFDGVTNKSLQEEEIQVMYSIYDSEWQVEDPFKNNSYSIKISNSSGNSVFFKVILPEDYPLHSPPRYLISAPWMSREVKNRLTAMLEDIYRSCIRSIQESYSETAPAVSILSAVTSHIILIIQAFVWSENKTQKMWDRISVNSDHKADTASYPPSYLFENIGNCILYDWVVKIQDFINGELTKDNICNDANDLVDSEDTASTVQLNQACELFVAEHLRLPSNDEELPPITHGETIEDRKSVFQGHVAKVVSVDQVKKILSKLKENRKIAIATHNILAYRISIGPNSYIQDCDDDGENRAGPVLLELLERVDVKDVVVIVSRWYGGVHLGADRFKDIKNAARKGLVAAGFICEKTKGYEKKH